MAQSTSTKAADEENLKCLFEKAMKLFDNIENGNEATNTDPVQVNIYFCALICLFLHQTS